MSEEAEGGAQLLAGPSLYLSPQGKRWHLIATGAPVFHPSDTGREQRRHSRSSGGDKADERRVHGRSVRLVTSDQQP
jgi:hypothetical protein